MQLSAAASSTTMILLQLSYSVLGRVSAFMDYLTMFSGNARFGPPQTPQGCRRRGSIFAAHKHRFLEKSLAALNIITRFCAPFSTFLNIS
ncbi:uncharacterized protein EV420DRAFT_465685 [Desarmillaria tabescens]|uniref:Secreted protein n=1 Tax=Armillaria tabescens TaxID=1929756 RepID=A0AA39U0W2_ARMTA|nr:uncharacterized protein EV420DRAFT_465685 [Desarmillaria tabescens]KAK0468434.1 hypothetical protein EV420DRAFT_465685 [Desarmillaria tabescens]